MVKRYKEVFDPNHSQECICHRGPMNRGLEESPEGDFVDIEDYEELKNQLAKANERVKDLEEENGLMMTRLMAAALGLASGKSCPTAIEELNKFAIEQQIEALAHVLSSYKTQKFCPTNYAIQAFNDGVAHLWAHIVNCEMQLRKGGE